MTPGVALCFPLIYDFGNKHDCERMEKTMERYTVNYCEVQKNELIFLLLFLKNKNRMASKKQRK